MYKYLDLRNKTEYDKLKDVAKILKNGKVIVFPTETVYGIGTNGLNEKAIKKLYNIKKRSLNKPISLLVNTFDMINEVAQNITDLEWHLIKKFFPGSLTIVLKKKEIVPDILTANTKTVGIRMPSNKIALDLIKYANTPIATSSANISGKPNETSLNNIMRDLNGQIDCFIDGGITKEAIPSTVIQIINETPIILRQGVISEKEIVDYCIEFKKQKRHD